MKDGFTFDDYLESVKKSDEPNYYNDNYLQDAFRKQAQKRVDITKARLNPGHPHSHDKVKRRALERALSALEQFKGYNKETRTYNGSKEKALEIFEMFYQKCIRAEFNKSFKSDGMNINKWVKPNE